MSRGEDNAKRKAALKKWKAQQRGAARQKLPLSNAQMKALFDMLNVELPRQACNHTLRLVRAWLADQGVACEPVEAWLHENGGHCDCEVLANAE